MRVTAVGLISLPVVVGALGIAAAVAIVGSPDAEAPAGDQVINEGSTVRPGELSPNGGTPIEGSRPHLTVRDGSSTVTLPGATPGFLSLLPTPVPVPVPDLPSLEPFAAITGPHRLGSSQRTGPATGPAIPPSPVGAPAPTTAPPPRSGFPRLSDESIVSSSAGRPNRDELSRAPVFGGPPTVARTTASVPPAPPAEGEPGTGGSPVGRPPGGRPTVIPLPSPIDDTGRPGPTDNSIPPPGEPTGPLDGGEGNENAINVGVRTGEVRWTEPQSDRLFSVR